jgi:hypothetical protein
MNQAEFISYLSKLTPEGETTLIVRQKPTLKDGELQYHADGAIKCTWPAYLPTHNFKPEWTSLYGNTGSFIIDRFVDGRVSASAANVEYVAVMVLDDIGTKSREPPLAPTWVIQTSPGCFQWGYVFNDQPTKGEFSAAIRAIAEAGYTDKGALNPVRNFRIPGSVNIKPGKNGYVSTLEFINPKAEFSLAEICAALGVTPGEADSATVRPVRLSDDGADDVLAWISGKGLLLTPPNADGWAGIICPNSAAHSDGNPEARYLATTRAFCCYHSCCTELHSKEFLEWVEREGGPTHTHGVRDELLAPIMEAALEKLTPTAMFSDKAKEIVAEVETRQLGRLEMAEWYERFAYIQSDESYFDMQDRREISRATFDALYRHIDTRSIHPNGNSRPKVRASIAFDENRQAKGAHALVGITYCAGESVLVSRDGMAYGNRWKDARPPRAAAGNVKPWLDHVEALLPEDFERRHVLDVMAYKLQHPEGKINHAVLHAGVQGCGKDTMWAPLLWAVCGPHGLNKGQLDGDGLQSQWGYALEAEILILNELREPEAAARRALANKLKPIIAAPPDTLTINRKGLHPYQLVNRLLVLAFSNDAVPISLESQDRRWFVVYSHAPRLTTDAATRLWNWYNAGGFEAVAAWLYARDVSAFNPAATPPMTEAKTNLVEHGMSAAESFLVDMIRGRAGEFARGVVGSPLHRICDRVQAQAPSGTKVPQSALLHALQEAGWVDCGNLHSAEFRTKKHVFCAPEMVERSKSDLRRLVEEVATPTLALVKKG